MLKKFSFLISKIMRRIRPPALRRCVIDPKAHICAGCDLTDVEVGRYTYLGYNCQAVECTIGSFCSIADDVKIGRGEHPISAVSTSPIFHRGRNVFKRNFAAHTFDRGGKTEIGNDVWIGLGVIVKAGVRIGSGAVVGAGSVVTKDIEPYSVSAGVPAREIRKRFSDETCAALLESSWWGLSDSELEDLGRFFTDPDSFLREVKASGGR